jgi:hypothetical protein
VYALSWGRYDADVNDTVRTFGVFIINWHALDEGGEWNNNVRTYYANVEGFIYKRGNSNPERWKGIINLNTVWKIERFPRQEYFQIR